MKKFLSIWLVATGCVSAVIVVILALVKFLVEFHKTNPLVSVYIVLLLFAILLGFIWTISTYKPS